jgi:hypothetical protein
VELTQQHPKWSGRAAGLVACHQIDVGLTAEQVLAAWGNPDGKNTTQAGSSRSEMWWYGANYAAFEDGVVTSFQGSPKPR